MFHLLLGKLNSNCIRLLKSNRYIYTKINVFHITIFAKKKKVNFFNKKSSLHNSKLLFMYSFEYYINSFSCGVLPE